MSNKREALEAAKDWITQASRGGENNWLVKKIDAALAEPQDIDSTIKNELWRRFKPTPKPITEDELMAYKALCAALMKIQRGGSQTLEDDFDKERASKAEPEQEPVAKQYKHSRTGEWCNFIDEKHYKETVESGLFEIRSLYTSPQPREWQELSEDEFAQLRQKCVSLEDLCSWSFHQGAMLAEGELRAKNGG